MQERKDFAPAFLVSKGLNERRATLHVFDHSEIIALHSEDSVHPIRGMAHFYKCTETGAIRRWGFDSTWGKDNHEQVGN